MMKVVIVGGVAGGMSAAAKLKRNLKEQVDIEVFEKGAVVSYAACGIPYFVSGRIPDASMLVERTPEQFVENGIDVKIRHEVAAVDAGSRRVTVRNLETGERFERPYDKLIVASGARVRKIPPLDVERDNLHVVRDIGDAVRIRRQLEEAGVRAVVIVGGGFIGLEMAEACSRMGKNVILVEFAARILPVMDPEFTDRMTRELEANNVAVRVDSRVTELECDGGRIVSVSIESGQGRDEIPVDMVINCAGIVPCSEFIDVAKAVNGAILVNERMETSAPDVYAAGDCSIMTSFLTNERQYAPLGTNANKQGRIIAELLSGKRVEPFRLIGSSAIRLFDLDAAKVGLSEMDAQRLNLDYKANRITGNSHASYYSKGKVVIKLIYAADSRKLLGAQTMGHGSVVPRANYFAIAMNRGMTVDEFALSDLCYSPPFSGVWDAALIAANTAR